LFTDLKSSTQLYQQIGDLNAFALVRNIMAFEYSHLEPARGHCENDWRCDYGDFQSTGGAVCAGLDMLSGLQRMNQASHHGDLTLKIGIHRGAAISVTLNERIDYFGQTVNIASRVQGLADAGEIYITDEAFNYPGVESVVAPFDCVPMQADVKGVRSQLRVHKIAAR
jgi:class 3 adenylate cyclase